MSKRSEAQRLSPQTFPRSAKIVSLAEQTGLGAIGPSRSIASIVAVVLALSGFAAHGQFSMQVFRLADAGLTNAAFGCGASPEQLIDYTLGTMDSNGTVAITLQGREEYCKTPSNRWDAVKFPLINNGGWFARVSDLSSPPGSTYFHAGDLTIYDSTHFKAWIANILPGAAVVPPVVPALIANSQKVFTVAGYPAQITLTGYGVHGLPTTFQILTFPAHGRLDGSPPNLTYTPADTNFVGFDTFTFKASDGTTESAPGTVIVDVQTSYGCDLESGPELMGMFPASSALADLEPAFAARLGQFLAALASAVDVHGKPNPARVTISETLQTPARAYLIHYAYLVGYKRLDPSTIPDPSVAEPPVTNLTQICWFRVRSDESLDMAGTRRAAAKMIRVAAPGGIAKAPAYPSNHQFGTAVDMTITWRGTIIVNDASGNPVKITGARNGAANRKLWDVGATYGVKKLPSDRPHWSADGY